MAIAASGSVKLAEKIAHGSASEMRMAGINWECVARLSLQHSLVLIELCGQL
jgi:beta-glucosidase-like glycosyl hydrolase